MTNLLIVDDEQSIRSMLRMFFQRQGYAVSVAGDGAEAIRIAKTQAFDLILMDIQMPVMTGIEAVRALREDETYRERPIIAFTAYARSHTPASLQTSGFDRVVFKPFELIELHELVGQLIAGHSSADAQTV